MKNFIIPTVIINILFLIITIDSYPNSAEIVSVTEVNILRMKVQENRDYIDSSKKAITDNKKMIITDNIQISEVKQRINNTLSIIIWVSGALLAVVSILVGVSAYLIVKQNSQTNL